MRLGLDRRHGRTLAARHRFAPGPAPDARRTARGRAAGPRPANRSCAIGKLAFVLADGADRHACEYAGRRRRQEGGVDAARHARGPVGLRGDSRRHRAAVEAARDCGRKTSIACSWRADSATISAAATPSGSACCRPASSTSGSATKATPRWPGPGWPAFRGVAGRRARACRADRARRSFAGAGFRRGVCRGDDFSGTVEENEG